MTALGVDVSKFQDPAALPWVAWRAGGLTVACVQMTHGEDDEPHGEEHLIAAIAAGVPHVGIYHFLLHGNVEQQFLGFTSWVGYHDVTFAALDIEAPALTAADVLMFCGLWEDNGIDLPLVLYGNNLLASIVAAHPALAKYGVWWAQYGPAPHPAPGLRMVAWQYAGNDGHLPPYTGAIDLTTWFEIPGATMPTIFTPRGSFIGVHSINPGNTLAQALQSKADGADIPGYVVLNDPAACAQIADATGKPVYCRFDNISGDDESLNNVTSWNDNDRYQWSTRQWTHILANATDEQIGKIAGFISHNEADPPGVAGWQAMGMAYSYLAGMAATANAWRQEHGKPVVHLAYGATAQGTPESDEADALIGTKLFDKIAAAGDTWLAHEGVYRPNGVPDPIDKYYRDAIPGLPALPYAGAYNFRWVYLFEKLLARGTPVKIAITEFYDGGGYPGDPTDHVTRFGWVDAHLASLPAEYARWFLFFAGFTCNPDDHWRNISNYDAFYLSPELRAYRLSVKDRQNGVTTMPIISDADYAAAVLAINQAATILQKYSAPPAHLWRPGDVALAAALPLTTYNAPNGAVHDVRPNAAYDLNVIGVSADGLWLQVSQLPIWVRTVDVKLKGT